jgi:hypothetical protein
MFLHPTTLLSLEVKCVRSTAAPRLVCREFNSEMLVNLEQLGHWFIRSLSRSSIDFGLRVFYLSESKAAERPGVKIWS